MDITISGPIGSGKSTVARALARQTGRRYFSFGDIFRQNAIKLGMSVEEFNVYAETHPDVDRTLDQDLIEKMRNESDLVVDSRLAGWLSHRENIPAFRVYISAPFDIRASRVAGREGITPDQASHKIVSREESEGRRYRILYGIDIRDTSIYDVVVDSGALTPEEVLEQIVLGARGSVDGVY